MPLCIAYGDMMFFASLKMMLLPMVAMMRCLPNVPEFACELLATTSFTSTLLPAGKVCLCRQDSPKRRVAPPARKKRIPKDAFVLRCVDKNDAVSYFICQVHFSIFRRRYSYTLLEKSAKVIRIRKTAFF